MTDLLDPGLRARYDAAVPPVPLDAGAVLRGARRRRRGRQVGGALAAVALVAVVAVGATALMNRADPPPAGPPPVDASASGLWLSAERVAPGADVVGVLVDETGQHVYDQLATVERWVDGAWQDGSRPLLWCLPGDGCSAEVLPPGTVLDYEPVEITPTSGEPGPAMRMSTAGLEPGWYRITHTSRGGVEASALLEVAADATAGAPLPPLGEASLDVRPVLVAAGDALLLTLSLLDADGDAADATPADAAAIQAWQDGAWAAVAEGVPLGGGDVAPSGIVVPPLAPGEYRVVVAGPDGDAWGRFWVLPAPELSSAPAEVLESYVGLPEQAMEEGWPGDVPPGEATFLSSGDATVTISLPGSGDCAQLPVATELSGRTLTIVLREAPTACGTDGTHTTYVLALPDDAPAEPTLTTRLEASLDARYVALRAWLADVVEQAGLPMIPYPSDDSGRYAVIAVWPREPVAVVAELADEVDVAAAIVPDGAVEVGPVTVETGVDPEGAAAGRFACGGLELSFIGRNDTPEAAADVEAVARALAGLAGRCPADVDELLAAYPEA